MNTSTKIYVAGHRGLVGSSIVRRLTAKGYRNLVLRTHAELDLMDQSAVRRFFAEERPECVIDAAARVGGINANMNHLAEFLYENLEIQNNLIWGAREVEVQKFLFLGSSCIYPRDCPQPIKEEYLLGGVPEPTNEGYAIAKIAGMKLCEFIHKEFGLNFISCMPTNIYGENDDFNPETSHVVSSLVRRVHEAKVRGVPEVVIWGTGACRREFLYVDDLADAVVWLLENYNDRSFINIGTGEDITIKELAERIKRLIEYEGRLIFDSTKPEGVPRKLLDVSKLRAGGWKHQIGLEDGLKRTYEWYLANVAG